MPAIIYRLTNTINGKTYIGLTSRSLDIRWRQHCSITKFGSSYHIHNAIRKYGPDVFAREILEHTTIDAMNERECYWISQLTPEYNMTTGGEGMANPTPETRAKLSASRMGPKNGFYGKTHSNETRLKISDTNKGRSVSDEVRSRISAASKLRWSDTDFHKKMCLSRQGTGTGKDNPMYGKTGAQSPTYGRRHTTEAKLKMGILSKQRNTGKGNPMYGKKHSPETRAKLRAAHARRKALRESTND